MSQRKAKSTNPHTGEVIAEYDYISDSDLKKVIERSYQAFQDYRKVDNKTRAARLEKLSQFLNDNVQKYAETITKEQGKPINESLGEVKKAAKHAKYYADNIDEFLKDEVVETEYKKSVVEFHPMGPIYHIAPFNFPLWLVFKSVIPSITLGNTIISKTASACPQTGMLIEEAFQAAGFVNGEFQFVLTTQEQSEIIISHPYVQGVSFTGSTQGGSAIAELPGKHCKKAIMELGGSDPFLVFDDADLEVAAEVATNSRLRNTGQVCTCAKRFIVHEKVYDDFKNRVMKKFSEIKIGDPMNKDTTMGPLTKKKVLEDIDRQVQEAVKQGGKVLYGGKRATSDECKKGFYYEPTIVEVNKGNILLKEETFGPVMPLVKASDLDEMVKIANDSEYGLGGTIISKDVEKAQLVGRYIDVGSLFYNTAVTSDSRLPSGGVKNSGFGRECGKYGLREFCNIKTVVIKDIPNKQVTD